MMFRDQELYGLYMGILALLVVASIIGFLLEWRVKTPRGRETVANINSRIKDSNYNLFAFSVFD